MKEFISPIERKKCHSIIHTAAVSAGAIGAGMAQLPVPDSVALVPIQTTMIVALAKVFDKKMDRGAAKALATQYLAQEAGQFISRFFIGKIPVAGNIINSTTAASITEAYGWLMAKEFAEDKYKHLTD
ncbi:hypothetical protein [Vagococcus humatus]|uniref:hypothetical protein n=1 Tax=Vagococcus humatus TaxID=1889241 RepID=UPI001FB31B06|nr:hypothetical protein [Vagococcus humatus]